MTGKPAWGVFYADAEPVQWIRHKGEAADKDRINLIYRATRYGKNNDIKILSLWAKYRNRPKN